jgi:hypothetical protein
MNLDTWDGRGPAKRSSQIRREGALDSANSVAQETRRKEPERAKERRDETLIQKHLKLIDW